MKRKLAILLLLIVLCMLTAACAKCIDTKQETVEVVITDEHYRGPYTTFAYSGKVMVPIHHAATYRITVEYNGVEYDVHGRDVYDAYKDRIGETVEGILEIRTYDDGTVKYEIVSLEG